MGVIGSNLSDNENSETSASTAVSDAATSSPAANGETSAETETSVEAAKPVNQPTDSDQPLAQGEAADFKGFAVSVSNIHHETDFFGTYLCADVNLENNSGRDQSFDQFDFKVAKPNGVVADPAITGLATLEYATLTDGGHTEGSICFDSDGAPGEYKVMYEGNSIFSPKKASWSGTL